MLTRSGKIVFMLAFVAVSTVALFVFLKSTPDTSSISVNEEQATTRFEPTEKVLETLSRPLSLSGVGAEIVDGPVYFSPNTRHLLFQASPKKVEGQLETGSMVVLADMQTGAMKKVYDGLLVGEPSWSENIVSFASDGVYMFNMNEGVLNIVSPSGSDPEISSNERFVAYQDGGINIFSIQSRTTTSLTKDAFDKPGMWMSDNTRLLLFKSDSASLGEKAGNRQYVGIIDSVTKEITELMSVPRGRFYNAVSIGSSVLVSGGFDDGRSLYVLDTNKDTSTTILQNASLSDVFLDTASQSINVYTNGLVETFNHLGIKESAVTLSELPVPKFSSRWFKSDGSNSWIGFINEDTSKTEIVKWDMTTGDRIGESLVFDSSVVFFSPTSLFVLVPEDKLSLKFNTLK